MFLDSCIYLLLNFYKPSCNVFRTKRQHLVKEWFGILGKYLVSLFSFFLWQICCLPSKRHELLTISCFVFFVLKYIMFDSGLTSSFQVDFGLKTRWPEYTYIYLYEMFYKAEVLKNDHNFFRPVSQLKTSVIVWYLLNPVPPSQSVSHLTASQAKSIWGLTDEELESNYHESDRGECWSLYNRVPQIIVLLIMEEAITDLATCRS